MATIDCVHGTAILINRGPFELVEDTSFMPSRLGYGLYKKKNRLKIFFVVYSITKLTSLNPDNILSIFYFPGMAKCYMGRTRTISFLWGNVETCAYDIMYQATVPLFSCSLGTGLITCTLSRSPPQTTPTERTYL